MPVYVVSYDIKLGAGTHDYDDLYAAFAKLDAEKILYSVYLVSVQGWTATDLHQFLKQHMDEPDRIWVSRVTDDHSGFIMADGADWLEQHKPL